MRSIPLVPRATPALATLALVACGGEPTQPPAGPNDTLGPGPDTVIVSLAITPAVDTLTRIGGTLQLSAVARNAAGDVLAGKPVIWFSSSTDVATVDSTGRVTAVNTGTAVIDGYSQSKAGTATLTVDVVPASMTLSTDTVRLFTVGQARVGVTLRDSGGAEFTRPDLAWTSADPSIASVVRTTWDSARVTGLDVGTIDLVVAVGNLADTVPAVVTYRRYASLSSQCGATAFATVECWGLNVFGQIGSPAFSGAAVTPRIVVTPQSFMAVQTLSNFNCALNTENESYCWGLNNFGQLGNGETTGPDTCVNGQPCSRIPVAVAGGLTFAQPAVGAGTFACALTQTASVSCWGTNDRGQFGNNSTTWSAVPVAVLGGVAFASLSAGGSHACGLSATGDAYCWGDNQFGQLGTGSPNGPEMCDNLPCSTTPVAVSGGLQFVSLSLARGASCGIATDGSTYCWGRNHGGQLGNGDATGPQLCGTDPCAPSPVAVTGGLAFSQISAGAMHVCGLTGAGAAYCWGANSRLLDFGPNYGRLGVDTAGMAMCRAGAHCAPAPVAVSGGFTFAALAAGGEHTCGLTPEGIAVCWGANGAYQLADGTENSRFMPTPVAGSQ